MYVTTAIGEIRQGQRVRIKAGTEVRCGNPNRRRFVLKRRHDVQIRTVWPPSPEVPNGMISWVSGRHICAVYIDAIEEIVGG